MKTSYEYIPQVDLQEIFFNTNRGEFDPFRDISFEKHLKSLYELVTSTREKYPNLSSEQFIRKVMIQHGYWYRYSTRIKA